MNVCPNTSLTCNVWDVRCCRRKHKIENRERVTYVFESNSPHDELCVLGPGTIEDELVVEDNTHPMSSWECIAVNHRREIITMQGPKLSVHGNCVGKKITDVLTGNLLHVTMNLLTLCDTEPKKRVRSLNIMYGRKPMTLQTFSLLGKKNNTIAIFIVMRHTSYNNADLLAFLNAGEAITSSSASSPSPSPATSDSSVQTAPPHSA